MGIFGTFVLGLFFAPGGPQAALVVLGVVGGLVLILTNPIVWLAVRHDDGRRPSVEELATWRWVKVAGDTLGWDRARLRLVLVAGIAPLAGGLFVLFWPKS